MQNVIWAMKDIGAAVSRMSDSPIHGIKHWSQVCSNAIMLMQAEQVESVVPIAFSYLHDCLRENEDEDPKHGERAGSLVLALKGTLLKYMDHNDVGILANACRDHSKGMVIHPICSSKVTGICWDADRLDLGRPGVGIIPNPAFMSTETGKALARKQVNGFAKATIG